VQCTASDLFRNSIIESLTTNFFTASCPYVSLCFVALVQALDRRGIDGESRVPWYFPTPGDYATRLERAGFRVNSIALIPRPTPLPGDIIGWLETFGESFLAGLDGQKRDDYLQEVRAVLEPQLVDPDGIWIADYVRLRFSATKV